MIIAVDGPAGAGKSTVAKLLAKKLGFLYIDTGAMYRALTLKAIETNTDVFDIPAMALLANNTDIELVNDKEAAALKVFLDGKDVSREIREPRITKIVSDVAKIKEVRQVMLVKQRRCGKEKDSVLDGRDIGTVVFPDADIKFFVDAKFDERAMRRYKELIGNGQKITLDDVKADLANRDRIDSTREVAPLKKADDAVYVDTTNMTIEQVVDKLVEDVSKIK